MQFHSALLRCGSPRAVLALVLVLTACASDAAVSPAPITDVARMYWALTLDHHAVTLSTVAPYDTIRLTATPRTVSGEPLSDLPAPVFASLDLDRAAVSADGLVHVLKSGSRIPIMATLAVGNLRHADTVLINVTDVAPPPVLAALSIHPLAGDSAKSALAISTTLEARAIAGDSTAIFGLVVYYSSLDRTIATIDRTTGAVQALRVGHVMMIATATAYGVTKADTLPFTIGYPVLQYLSITAQHNANGQTVGAFPPNSIIMGPGGAVWFSNQTTIATDVTFDDPTNVLQVDAYCVPPFSILFPLLCGSGNIEAFALDPEGPIASNGFRARRFPVPGTYPFHSTINGTSGTIVVVDESTTP
jgi:hypothetical protein